MKLNAAIWIAAGALLLSGCLGDDPLVVVVQMDPAVDATCFKVRVTQPPNSSAPHELIIERSMARQPGQTEHRMAVFRGSFPQEVDFQVLAQRGPNECSPPLTTISASAYVPGDFATRPGREIPIFIGPSAERLDLVPPTNKQVALGVCTPVTVEGRFDGGLATVFADTPVLFARSPSTGLMVFGDAQCTTLVGPGTQIPLGGTSVVVRLLASDAGTYQLTASAVGLAPDTETIAALPALPTSLKLTNLPTKVVRGACIGPLNVQLVDVNGAAAMAGTTTSAALTTSGAAAAFYSDGACSQPISSVALPAWSSSPVTTYLKPSAAGIVSATASTTANYAPNTQSVEVVPTVRAGTCTLGVGELNVSCPITEPVLSMSRALSVVQAIPSGTLPHSASARCTLSSPAAIDCFRDAGVGTIDIGWQVAELAGGVTVQRVKHDCSNGRLATLPQPVAPSQSFVLYSAQHTGNVFDEDDHKTVRLVDGGSQVDFLTDSACGNGGVNDVQVVDLTGAVVHRAVTGGFSGLTRNVTGMPSLDPARTFHLSSERFTANPDAGALCELHVRGELTNATDMTFRRGDGNVTSRCSEPPVADVSFERVQLPAGYSVRQLVLAITDGGSMASAPLVPSVDPTRTLVFASGQFVGGQSYGETSFAGVGAPGAVGARFSLSAPGNRVDLLRGVDAGTSRWTVYVVEFP